MIKSEEWVACAWARLYKSELLFVENVQCQEKSVSIVILTLVSV